MHERRTAGSGPSLTIVAYLAGRRSRGAGRRRGHRARHGRSRRRGHRARTRDRAGPGHRAGARDRARARGWAGRRARRRGRARGRRRRGRGGRRLGRRRLGRRHGRGLLATAAATDEQQRAQTERSNRRRATTLRTKYLTWRDHVTLPSQDVPFPGFGPCKHRWHGPDAVNQCTLADIPRVHKAHGRVRDVRSRRVAVTCRYQCKTGAGPGRRAFPPGPPESRHQIAGYGPHRPHLSGLRVYQKRGRSRTSSRSGSVKC